VAEIRNWRRFGPAQRLAALGHVAARRRGLGMDITPRDVLGFWFSHEAKSKWFVKDADFDREIRIRFEEAWRQGLDGAFDSWAEQPEGALALIVLLDQFPRNMFRGDPRSFASDDKALQIAEAAIAQGLDQKIGGEYRRFFYLPFEHAEDLARQQKCVAYFEAMPDDAEGLDYARRHLAIIERFGRFPHRNEVLGRATTAEEEAFLREPGSSF
jgi:uncharacterized protein (DUF924 family)